MENIAEPARRTPVAEEVDLCVVGGSCTGVFAAVRASWLGLRVAIIEAGGFFGGVATAGLVCVWHTILDTRFERTIIGGLTTEILERLKRRSAVRVESPDHNRHSVFNSEELKIELDELVTEARVIPHLHTRFVAPVVEGGRVSAAIIEDKTGRRAIRARFFVDASGDGDLLVRAGLPHRPGDGLQPATVCAVLEGLEAIRKEHPDFRLAQAVFDPRYPEALRPGFLWHVRVPGPGDRTMVAGTRAHGLDCSDAEQLTRAEIEGRRQVRALCDLLRRRFQGAEAHLALVSLASHIGIRETRHALGLHTLTEMEVLEGARFPDAIANGSYRVDVHHHDRPGLTFRYLDGAEEVLEPQGSRRRGRWREPRAEDPTFYQIPYRSLVPRGAENVLVAGRLTDADRGAYGAIRVMVNCNQTGEAAGAAAALALRNHCSAAEVKAAELRELLRRGGSIVL